jgi:hypothetical protein
MVTLATWHHEMAANGHAERVIDAVRIGNLAPTSRRSEVFVRDGRERITGTEDSRRPIIDCTRGRVLTGLFANHFGEAEIRCRAYRRAIGTEALVCHVDRSDDVESVGSRHSSKRFTSRVMSPPADASMNTFTDSLAGSMPPYSGTADSFVAGIDHRAPREIVKSLGLKVNAISPSRAPVVAPFGSWTRRYALASFPVSRFGR